MKPTSSTTQPGPRHEIAWHSLLVVEPTEEELAAAASQLARFYNDPHNSAMMAHAGALSVTDVLEHFATLATRGDRGFHLLMDGALVGDADLRHVDGDHAEFAWMVGERSAQGRGLGTRFGLMVHAFAFQTLGLARVYATIIADNPASRRSLEKLGYTLDESPAARSYVDDRTDIALSVTREDWQRKIGEARAQIQIKTRV